MSEMVEKVARALDDCSEWPAKTYRKRLARAAIEAMREPDDSMMKAGWMAQYASLGATDAEAKKMTNAKILLGREKRFLREGWSAAIDAALKD